jgi:hypothetical protein
MPVSALDKLIKKLDKTLRNDLHVSGAGQSFVQLFDGFLLGHSRKGT